MTKREIGAMCCKLIGVYLLAITVMSAAFAASEYLRYLKGSGEVAVHARAVIPGRPIASQMLNQIGNPNGTFTGKRPGGEPLLSSIFTASSALATLVAGLSLWFAGRRLSRAIPSKESGTPAELSAALMFLLMGAWLFGKFLPGLANDLAVQAFWKGGPDLLLRHGPCSISGNAASILCSILLMLGAGWLARTLAGPRRQPSEDKYEDNITFAGAGEGEQQ